jgi:excisionase family DNA binding protein
MDDQPLLVTIAEAARRFGKSPRTIRRWIMDGRLPAIDTPTGKMVDLSGFAGPGEDGPPDRTGAEKGPDTAALELEIIRLQGEVAKLDALVQQMSGERDYLRQALAAALGTQKMLLAERAAAARPSRPWWKFWARG